MVVGFLLLKETEVHKTSRNWSLPNFSHKDVSSILCYGWESYSQLEQ